MSTKVVKSVVSSWLKILAAEPVPELYAPPDKIDELKAIKPALEEKGFTIEVTPRPTATFDVEFSASKDGFNMKLFISTTDIWPRCIKKINFQQHQEYYWSEDIIDKIKSVDDFKKELPALFDFFKKGELKKSVK